MSQTNSKGERIGPVKITWLDAWHSTEYHTEEEVAELEGLEVISTGFCLRSDKMGIVIACDYFEDGRCREVMFIPRGMVLEERWLK